MTAVVGFGPGFWAAVAASVFSALILGVLAYGKRAFYRELVEPLKKLKAEFKKEKHKRKRFETEILGRIERYELAASDERHAQTAERVRVGGN